ncbi:MAG: ABC transporter permease [Ilumatobacter sp.]|nr:MAG: ABC transporter permease [Ilumatobacter sp.]
MFAYSIRRILTTIPLLLVALYLVYIGVSVTTDPLAEFRLCLPRCQEGYDRIVELYNLDQSVFVRPFGWAADAITGDFGTSNVAGQPVSTVLWERGINSAMIAIPAFLLAAVLALLLSVYSARRQYSAGDYVLTGLSFFGIAFPAFVLGLVLQVIFAIKLPEWTGWKLFYTGGKRTDNIGEIIGTVTLPVVTLATLFVAADSRFGRAAMLEVINSDFIRTARAKGLSERRVIWRHALRNALIPLVTLWALNFSALLGGSVITESVFSWPGLGQILIPALQRPDLDMVMGIVIFTAIITVVFNLLADLLYGVLDPRIRYD